LKNLPTVGKTCAEDEVLHRESRGKGWGGVSFCKLSRAELEGSQAIKQSLIK